MSTNSQEVFELVRTIGAGKILVACFPEFLFAGAAGRFIEQFAREEVSVQLFERRISEIVIVPLDKINARSSSLNVSEDRNLAIIMAGFSSIPDQARQLGHGIANSFHYNLTHTPPINYIELRYRNGRRLDDFSVAFTELWLASMDRRNVKVFLDNLHGIGKWCNPVFASRDTYRQGHIHPIAA